MLLKKLQNLIVEKTTSLLSENQQLIESRKLIETEIKSVILSLITPEEQELIDNYKYLLTPQKSLDFDRDITIGEFSIRFEGRMNFHYWPFEDDFKIQSEEDDIFYPTLFGRDCINMSEWLKKLEKRSKKDFDRLGLLLIKHFEILLERHKKQEALSTVLSNPQLGLTELKKYFPELYKIAKN